MFIKELSPRLTNISVSVVAGYHCLPSSCPFRCDADTNYRNLWPLETVGLKLQQYMIAYLERQRKLLYFTFSSISVHYLLVSISHKRNFPSTHYLMD